MKFWLHNEFMDLSSQGKLVDIPEQPDHQKPPTKGQPKLTEVNRQQTMMAMIYVEELIGPDHKARAIWQLVERFDLKRFSESLRTAKGCAGRPAWNPQLLVSVWVYAYSEGISSAREIEGIMEWEPGFQWLSGLEKINHHTLSDFRVEHKQALDELFAQFGAVGECRSVEPGTGDARWHQNPGASGSRYAATAEDSGGETETGARSDGADGRSAGRGNGE
jgi:transposase